MKVLEKLQFQDRIIKFLNESSIVTYANTTSKFGLSQSSRKQVSSTLKYLIETGYISKKRGSTHFDDRYSLTAKGQDRALYTFEQEYLEQTETKDRQKKHVEISTLLAEEQRGYLIFTRRLSWASLLISALALTCSILFNYTNSHVNEKNRSGQNENNNQSNENPIHSIHRKITK